VNGREFSFRFCENKYSAKEKYFIANQIVDSS
jgi:hypothetical protein